MNVYNEKSRLNLDFYNKYTPIIDQIDNESHFKRNQNGYLKFFTRYHLIIVFVLSTSLFISLYVSKYGRISTKYKEAWSSKAEPFSTINPIDLEGIREIDRPKISMPGPIFGELLTNQNPLPTNGWYENLFLGESTNLPENKVFQVPYILDTAGKILGIRTHSCRLKSGSRTVEMIYEPENGVTLGSVEKLNSQHYIHNFGKPSISKLAIELEWKLHKNESESKMQVPLVRGSPYTSVKYLNITPRIYAERPLLGNIIVDEGYVESKILNCGYGLNNFTLEPVLVRHEMKFNLDISDQTWNVFVSEPTYFICSTIPFEDQTNFENQYLDIKSVNPMKRGMVRLAMTNNCTTGKNPQFCTEGKPIDQSDYESLLRKHSNIYPTAHADVEFTFPVQSSLEEEIRLIFNWRPGKMSALAHNSDDEETYDPDHGLKTPHIELLMFTLPHHQERLRPIIGSSNKVYSYGCFPTIQGTACPATGNSWSLVEHLHRISFTAPRAPRQEMVEAIRKSLSNDINFRLPENYMSGAGDTYFSGKMLAKLARILVIAEEVGGIDSAHFLEALNHLKQGTEIWLNGSAQSPLLYDKSWGGIISCGCNYINIKGKGACSNKYPDCPSLSDMGQNFGAGFYNDHHFHYGYHIFAASVIAKFDPEWAKKYHQHVLLLIRDIANPSDSDNYFTTWRHKDWYLGFSWASGIVTINGKPYPNGLNQESSSEAIAAYEAVALYGDVMSKIFFSLDENSLQYKQYDNAMRIREMGRLLLGTEIRSARTYWHVFHPNTPGVSRIYPEIYSSNVVGMLWSLLAQEQTWFGNEPWKSYGIQLIPLTPITEQRDSIEWTKQMLPAFQSSCFNDPSCAEHGWSVLVYTSMATIGQWKEAWHSVEALDPTTFEQAGGNGQSLTNTLWFIATRSENPIIF